MNCCKEQSTDQCCGGGCSEQSNTCGIEENTRGTQKMCCGGMCANDVSQDDFAFDNEHIYTRGFDVGKLVLLSVLSSSVFQNYWFYRNWKNIKEYKQLSLRPVLRAIFSFLPIFDIILFCLQFKRIHELAREEKRRTFPLVWTCIGYSFFLIISWLFFVAEFVSATDAQLTFALFFFQLLAVIFMSLVLIPVQLSLNDIWAQADRGKILRTSYTNGEIAWLVIGSILMLFSIYSIYSAQPLPLDSYTSPSQEQQDLTPQNNSQG